MASLMGIIIMMIIIYYHHNFGYDLKLFTQPYSGVTVIFHNQTLQKCVVDAHKWGIYTA